jgi:hypothetical protein
MRSRYGRLSSIEENWTDRATGQMPTAGRARVPYILHFERFDVDAEAEFAITEDGRPPMVLKWGWLRNIDPRGGDLVYPVSAAQRAKPQATTSPS